MIQRIQSIYLAIAIICMGIISSGLTMLRFEDKGFYALFSVYGKVIYTHQEKINSIRSFPLYIASIAIVLLLAYTLFSFKNLKLQLQLSRISMLLYLLFVLYICIVPFIDAEINKGVPVDFSMSIGFYVAVLGFPFAFLAQSAIKRDKKLLDSLNRLR